jgi:hypothetical protein
MVLTGMARIILGSRSDRSRTGVLYIPADIVKDSLFPFAANEEVLVRIEGEKLVVERRSH